MILQRRLRFPAFWVGALLIPFAATAAPIQFRMTGTIDVQFLVGPLPPGFVHGGPFEAILSYDMAAPDDRPDDPQRGYYFSQNQGQDDFLIIRAGTSEIRSLHDLALWVGNDLDTTQALFELPNDTFATRDVEFQGNFEHSRIALMKFQWNDPTRSAFSSDALPISLDPSQFIQPYIEVRTFQLDPRIHQFAFHANVETIKAIPEPSSLPTEMIAIVVVFRVLNVRCFRRANVQHINIPI